jgi:hypothetical protein
VLRQAWQRLRLGEEAVDDRHDIGLVQRVPRAGEVGPQCAHRLELGWRALPPTADLLRVEEGIEVVQVGEELGAAEEGVDERGCSAETYLGVMGELQFDS